MIIKPRVSLYHSYGLGLIILAPSGVMYTNQAGGHSCMQPEEEGFFAPLHNEFDQQEKMLLEFFTKRNPYTYVDIAGADFIDSVLDLSVITRFLKVDRTRLSDSMEAWVYVDVGTQPPEGFYTGTPEDGKTRSGAAWRASDYPDLPIAPELYPINGFGSCKGVLTWCNSD